MTVYPSGLFKNMHTVSVILAQGQLRSTTLEQDKLNANNKHCEYNKAYAYVQLTIRYFDAATISWSYAAVHCSPQGHSSGKIEIPQLH